MSGIEVLSGPERRRRWSAEQKWSIVAEAFAAAINKSARGGDRGAGQPRKPMRPGSSNVVIAIEARAVNKKGPGA